MRKLILILSQIFLFSCANNPVQHAEFAQKYNLTQKIYPAESTKGFNILTLQKIPDPKKKVRIYVEGDGFAYVNKSRPSVDPTPRSTVLLDLMEQDDHQNLVYVARPCQYIDSEKCHEKYWTTKRFSKEIIQSLNIVIDDFRDHEIELVGYSGGGLVVLALDHKNVKNIRTIAGNLDFDEFARLHRVKTIKTAIINYPKLSIMPQIHFIGAFDNVVPIEVFNKYQRKLLRKNCVSIKVLGTVTHNTGWTKRWREMLKVKPECTYKCRLDEI